MISSIFETGCAAAGFFAPFEGLAAAAWGGFLARIGMLANCLSKPALIQ